MHEQGSLQGPGLGYSLCNDAAMMMMMTTMKNMMMLIVMTMMNMIMMMMRLSGVLSFCRGGYLAFPPPTFFSIHHTHDHHFCNDDYDHHNDHDRFLKWVLIYCKSLKERLAGSIASHHYHRWINVIFIFIMFIIIIIIIMVLIYYAS